MILELCADRFVSGPQQKDRKGEFFFGHPGIWRPRKCDHSLQRITITDKSASPLFMYVHILGASCFCFPWWMKYASLLTHEPCFFNSQPWSIELLHGAAPHWSWTPISTCVKGYYCTTQAHGNSESVWRKDQAASTRCVYLNWMSAW